MTHRLRARSTRGPLAAAFALLLLTAAAVIAADPADRGPDPIDWDRARALYRREQQGDKLTPDERAYLDRAKAQRQRGGGQRPNPGGDAAGRRPGAPAPAASTGMVPLNQMTATDRHKGEDGGLYGGGSNQPPEAHLKAALAEAAKIVPLDAAGKPSPDGKIVLMSMGMSNTTQEFSRFKQIADADPRKNPRLVIVDAAQGGRDAPAWLEGMPGASPRAAGTWDNALKRVQAAGATPHQVQVVWIKQAIIAQGQYGEFPKHARLLQEQLVSTLNLVKQKLPNVRIAYLSSRIYGGYAMSGLNPEPYAYEGAFAVRWLIQDQVKGDAKLNWDPAKGEVKAPLALWGPYLWADGTKAADVKAEPGKPAPLVYTREDLGPDGTHPSNSGRQKVADLLLNFFTTDPTAKGWFTKEAGR